MRSAYIEGERYAWPDILQMLYIYCAVYIGPAVKVGDIGEIVSNH